MSKHTPGPWHFVPWHIEEGQPAVRCAEGWIVATASTDADAEFIARAPAMPARIAELEAENKQLGDAYERNTNAAMQLHARAERAEADAEIGRKWRAGSSLETWFPYTAEELTRLRAERVAARADAERYRELRRLATQWPQTVLVVNINTGHDWRTADVPDEIDSVVDGAIAARGAA